MPSFYLKALNPKPYTLNYGVLHVDQAAKAYTATAKDQLPEGSRKIQKKEDAGIEHSWALV